MTAVALMGARPSRIELGTAVVPLQPATRSRWDSRRCRCRRRATVASASASGRRTTGSSTTCWGCPTTSRRSSCETTSTCSTPCSSGPDPVDVENDALPHPQPARRHRPRRCRCCSPRSVRSCCASPASAPRHRPLDGRRARHRRARRAPDHEGRGRRRPSGAARRRRRRRCACAPTDEVDGARRAGQPACSATPSTRRTTSGCSSRADRDDVGDMSALGTEADVERRLRSYADAGTTDFSARILPMGQDARTDHRVGRPDQGVPGLARARVHMRPTRGPALADDPGDGRRRRRAASATPRRWSTATAASTSPTLVDDARRITAGADRVGHRAGRPRRGLGAELARVDRRRARVTTRRRRARAGRTRASRAPRPRYVLARSGARVARSPSAGSSTPTTRRCSPGCGPSCPTSATVVVLRTVRRRARSLDDFVARGDAVADADRRRARRRDRCRRPERRRVHVGDDRAPEGRRDDARPDAARVPRLVRLGRPARRRPLPHRQPVLPHLRLQGRVPRVAHARRDDLPARRCSTPASCSTSSSASGSPCCPARRRSTSRCSTIPTATRYDISSCGSR